MKNLKKELGLSGNEKWSDFPQKFNKLLRIVDRLIALVSFLFAIIAIFLVHALPSEKLASLFAFIGFDYWNRLSEGLQLVIIGVVLSIPASIVIHYINKKFIDPLFVKEN